MKRSARLFWLAFLFSTCGLVLAESASTLDGITFAIEPGEIYVPLDKAAKSLGWPSTIEGDGKKTIRINLLKKRINTLRQLTDGSILVSLGDLKTAGATISPVEGHAMAHVTHSGHKLKITVSGKRVEIDLTNQRLRGWQGKLLIVDSRISSGRYGNTPTGDFTAGPYKARQHYSKKYNNASMPWSVQFSGHFFIHGFTSVPDRPASHGCIRLPLDGVNPARIFYEWVDVGTPIKISKQ